MKKLLVILFLFLTSCAGKYVVVQKLRVNLYHLQNLKTKEIEIILSDKDLKEGDIIKLWEAPEIEMEGNHYKQPKYRKLKK